MKNSKVVLMLSCLSKQDLKEFSRYANCDFFNRKKKAKTLLNILIKNTATETISKAFVFKKLYPDLSQTINFSKLKPHERKKIGTKVDSAMHELKIILEDFLIWNKLKSNKISKNRLLLDILQENGIDKIFFEFIEKLHVEYDTSFKNLFVYHGIKIDLYHRELNHPKTVQHDGNESKIDTLLFHLDSDYLVKKLSYSWHSIIEGKIKNKKIKSIPLLTKIMDSIEKGEMKASPFAYAYYYAIKSEINNSYSFDTYQIIKKNILPDLPFSDYIYQSGLFNLLVNYCHLLILESETIEAWQELQVLYDLGLKNDYLFLQQYLNYGDFYGIVVSACIVGKVDWALNFIDTYQNLLKENIRRPTVKLCYANLFLAQKKYLDCLEIMNSKIKTISKIDKIYEKNILTKCYYELGYTSLLLDWLEAYRKFLERNHKLANYLVKRLKNFIHFVKILTKLKEEQKILLQKELIQIHQNLSNCNEVANKIWLMEKVNEIMKLRMVHTI